MLLFRSSASLKSFSLSRNVKLRLQMESIAINPGEYFFTYIFHLLINSLDGRKSLGFNEKNKDNKEKIDYSPPKGTRDFYPEDQRLKLWLFNNWRKIALRYNFEEYDSSVVENEALFIRKGGDEVTQQLYNFEDKGGRRLALRPEMTPTLARMVLGKGSSLSLPIKWFSIPQCWRYERMTRGRRREHYQWNMDIWGVDTIDAEAELLSAITTSFKELGLTSKEVGIRINSRKLINDYLSSLNIPNDNWASILVIVDKLDKITKEEMTTELKKFQMTDDQIIKLLEFIQIKDINELSKLLDNKSEGLKDIQLLFQLATAYGYEDWLLFDPSVVRGLSYYTGIVFEGFDRSGELRAICGGGRYDQLLQSFGGESTPAVGFGFGDAVIIELLKIHNLLPNTVKGDVDVLIYAMNNDLKLQGVKISTELRNNYQINCEFVLQDKKSKWAFQRADKIGASKFLSIFFNQT